MIGIPGVVDPFSVLNLSKSIKQKIDNLISEKDTNGDNTLSIKESGVPEDIFDRIDKNVDGQAGRFEHVIAAHTRAHALNEIANYLITKKDTNGDGVLNVGELGVPEAIFARIDKNGDGQVGKAELNIAARTRAAINNMASDFLPDKASSNLDAIV